jgi:hypothetical protein
MKKVTLELAQLARKHGFAENCQYAINADGEETCAYDVLGTEGFTAEDIINAEVSSQIDHYLQPYITQL